VSELNKPHQEQGEMLKPAQGKAEKLTNHHEKEITKSEKNHGDKEHLENLNQAVEQVAISSEQPSSVEREQPNNHHPALVSKQLKDISFTRTMTRARKKLSTPSRAFSKVVHNPVIDRSSELVGKTVARPSSMLWGSIFAFIGTSGLLWATRHYGYEYNYFVVVMMFVIGSFVGIGLDSLGRLRRSKKQ